MSGCPNFMRFGGNTAYVEGWGLYAETLGRELGVYTDPYQYFGYLDSQLFRAIRLVVDTGIHSKGWTRDQTIQYILDNSSRGRSNATAETERYIAIPGQALAYKIGQLKISELRAKAERELGPKFDVREFHAQVLMTRRAAAGGAGAEDRPLDRGKEGGLEAARLESVREAPLMAALGGKQTLAPNFCSTELDETSCGRRGHVPGGSRMVG